MSWKPVADLPKVNAGKLHGGNKVWLHPVCAHPDNRFVCEEGWELKGWNFAPSKGAGPHAIVYEKTTPAEQSLIGGSLHAHFEPGIYWGHGDAKEMQFPATPQRKPQTRRAG
jgi:hypothetical protein